MAVTERSFTPIQSAAETLAEDLVSIIRNSVATTRRAFIAVSGGKTPPIVFDRSSQFRIDWRRVTVTLIDERWTTPDHDESNGRLVRKYLLQGSAKFAKFVSLFGGEPSPEKDQSACNVRLLLIQGPFDAIYLGMGRGGHIASLLPGDHPAINARHDLCLVIAASENQLPILLLSVSVFLQARQLFLLYSGKNKHAAFSAAKKAGNYRKFRFEHNSFHRTWSLPAFYGRLKPIMLRQC